jgi:ribosomal protein L30
MEDPHRHPGPLGDRQQAQDRGTLRALGLGKIGNVNTLPDRPEIRGMLARVPHLVEVQEN